MLFENYSNIISVRSIGKIGILISTALVKSYVFKKILFKCMFKLSIKNFILLTYISSIVTTGSP